MLAITAWSLNEKIPYNVVNVLVPGVLAIFRFVILFLGTLLIIFCGIYILTMIYKENFADLTSALVALLTMAVLVWFADQLSFIPWNIFVLFMLIHLMYLSLRIMLISNK